MTPTTPIIPGLDLPVSTYAKNQPPYQPLPCYKYDDVEGTVLMRWRMTWKERVMALLTGNVYVWLSTFNRPLQPINVQIDKPKTGK